VPTPRTKLPDLTPAGLLRQGVGLLIRFCTANGVPVPEVHAVRRDEWHFDACAFYRPAGVRMQGYGDGINICTTHCATPAHEFQPRAWSWPGSTTDRTPYGVVAHELGHHLDWWAGREKGRYWSDYGASVMASSGEPPLTSYAPNPAEWFAEVARLFVTNPALLSHVRPRAYRVLLDRWVPVGPDEWRDGLLPGVPDRVVKSLVNKGAP
jgi:hypothetical protein